MNDMNERVKTLLTGSTLYELDQAQGEPPRDTAELRAEVERLGRIHLGRVSSSHGPDYWELRVQGRTGTGQVVTVRMTPEQFTDLMSGAIALDVELETPANGGDHG